MVNISKSLKKNMRMQAKALDGMIDKYVKEIKSNSKAVEVALEKFLESEGIQVSESEYTEIKRLANTMNALDEALLSVSKPVEKPVKKKKPKRRKK